MHTAISGRAPVLAPSTAGAVTVAALSVLLLTSCAAPGAATTSPTGIATTTHGYVEGAEELSEPELSLALAGHQGALTLVDLLDGTGSVLPGAGGSIDALAGDGRFVYPSGGDADRVAVGVVDSGRWTVEHGDHFHYYRATAGAVGTLTGSGTPAIRHGDRRTAISFPASGEVVLLNQDDLAAGSLGDARTVTRRPHPGLLALPFAGHLLVTTPDQSGVVAGIDMLDDRGDTVAGSGTPCRHASDAITTRVGAVLACADGAVLVTAAAGTLITEQIPYPAGIAPAARSLAGRAGRPVVAGVTDPAAGAGPAGYWQLDTRRREWTFRPTDIPLLVASAVGDSAGLLVAVDTAGRIRVFGPDGGALGTSEPLLAGSMADPFARDRVRLIVDANRAYVSGPVEGVVLEVDFRDGARIARTFDGLDPQFLEQVG